MISHANQFDEHEPDEADAEIGDPELTAKHDRAIEALITEPTVEKAAAKAGTSPRTLYRYLSNPNFKRAYRVARRAAMEHAVALTIQVAPHAVTALAKIITDPNAPASAKVAAAAMILKFGRDSMTLDDLSERVETLEARDRPQANDRGRWG